MKRIVEEQSGESERFKKLCDTVLWELKKLPPIVGDMLFYDYSDQDFEPSEYELGDVRLAAANGFVEQDRDGRYSLNRQDPKVRRTFEAIDSVANVLNEASESFHEAFIERYDFNPDLKNKRLWKECFELR